MPSTPLSSASHALSDAFQALAVQPRVESHLGQHNSPACPAPAFLKFTLRIRRSTSTDVESLTRWWTDDRFGPLACDGPDSWLRAFPLLRSVVFGRDGVVTISQTDCSPECADQAARAKKHIEKVTRTLQWLRCNSCGNNVASVEKACCEQSVSNGVETTFRMTADVIKSVFSEAWSAATPDDAERWLAIHDGARCDRSGKFILPALFRRTAAAKKVESDTLQMLNHMGQDSARLITHSCFRSRPFTLMASSFKNCHSLANCGSTSLTSTCSEKERSDESSYCFGQVIDKLLKRAVKHGVEKKLLSDDWSASTPSFGELPYANLRGVQICQECDALHGNHVVEFKTLKSISVSADSADAMRKNSESLRGHVRQMAISQTILRARHTGSFLVMIGRDHKVLVLEDVGGIDAAGLPPAFAWLKNSLDYWFNPNKHAFGAYFKQLAAVIAPYSVQSMRRKLQWDSDFSSDFSGWNFLSTLMAPVVAELNAAKEQAKLNCEKLNAAKKEEEHAVCTPAAANVAGGGQASAVAVPSVHTSFARGGGSAAPVSECGIGVELVLNANDGRVFISRVDRDRGAWRAGVHKDNCLLKVGNTFVSDVTHCATPAGGRKITYDEALDRVTKLLKGEKGSHVQVQVGNYCHKKAKYFTKTVDVERK